MSRSHPQQWTVVTPDEQPGGRPDPDLVAALGRYPTTQIADCGGPLSVMAPGIGHVAGGREACGVATTLWTKPGDILVVDAGGRLDAAVIGDIVGAAIQEQGAVGLVVDGAVRDVDGLDEIGLPTFARGVHPATASVTGPGALGVTVQCSGVLVEPGDVVRADRDGVVVVPRAHLADVVRLTEQVEARERGWREQRATGRGLPDVLGVDALIEAGRRAAAGTVGEVPDVDDGPDIDDVPGDEADDYEGHA